MTGDPAPSGVLTIELAGQRRTLTQTDMLTFGRAADLVVDDDNPYLHRVVGRFFCHEGNWWVENLGSYIEIEVVPVGEGASTRLTPHQPEGAPSAQSLPVRGFTLRFESNNVSYEINGRMDGADAGAAEAVSAVSGPPPVDPGGPSGDPAGPPPGGDGPSPFAVPPGSPSPFAPPAGDPFAPRPEPAPAPESPFNGAPPGSDAPQPAPILGDASFGSAPPFAPADPGPAEADRPGLFPGPPPDIAAPAPSAPSAPSGDPGEPALSADERQLLSLLAEPYWRDRGADVGALPTDADLAAALGWPEPKVGRTVAYLCNRLTRGGVTGLHGRGRRLGLARHVVESGLITGADVL